MVLLDDIIRFEKCGLIVVCFSGPKAVLLRQRLGTREAHGRKVELTQFALSRRYAIADAHKTIISDLFLSQGY